MNALKDKAIKRVNLNNIAVDFRLHDSDLGQEAERLLGYGSTKSDQLVTVLKRLEIQPLNAIDVAKYKKSKEYTGPYSHGSRTIRRWRAMDLAAYQGYVPKHVLAKAVQIKKAMPSVNFEVEALVEIKEHRRERLPDPFLVAVAPGVKEERVYIEVWDEPDFEKSLYA
jgi:hypothetical protein